MKVIKFAPAFSRLSQTFIYNLACRLREELDDFRVLTLERENAEDRPFDAVDVLQDVTSTPDSAGISIWQRMLGTAQQKRRTKRFIEYLDTTGADVVHAHFGPAAAKIIDACEATRTPLIVSLRGYDASRLLQERKWKKIYAGLFPRCHAIAVVTGEMRSRIKPYAGETPIVTVHAGKDAREYPYQPPEAPIQRFLSIGRLVEKKGHGDAIRALGHARSLGADVILDIIGDGELRHELETLIREQKLSNCVRLLGRLPHAQVKKMLREADGFVLASRTASNGDKEGVPNVLKEAQLVGLPVVTTRHAGIPDVVPSPHRPWLAEEGNWRALGKAIYEMSRRDSDALQQISQRARKHVKTEFSHRDEVRRYIELYSNTAAVKPAISHG